MLNSKTEGSSTIKKVLDKYINRRIDMAVVGTHCRYINCIRQHTIEQKVLKKYWKTKKEMSYSKYGFLKGGRQHHAAIQNQELLKMEQALIFQGLRQWICSEKEVWDY